jgi:cytochrome oxidase Cu insertion factor (SCO1/SenC/PrrC family)
MKKKRLTYKTLTEVEKTFSSLPHPLRVEREGKGPVRVVDENGNFIQLTSYNQLPTLLLFIQKNCPHGNNK